MSKFEPNASSSRVLVTGATGFIGARLFQPGDRGLVRIQSRMDGGWCGDLLNPSSLKAACDGIERVFHCAGYAHAVGTANAELHKRVNLEGTRNLVKAAGEAGVRRFVFLSSVKAMAEPGGHCVDEDWQGEPTTPYGKAKRAAEDVVCEAGDMYGMHVVNLRLAMVYGRGGRGNLARLAQGLSAGWFPVLPETGNRRSMVHVDDVVSAVRHVADHAGANGRTYIVADPQTYSGKQLCDAILASAGRPKLSWSAPEWVFRVGATCGDVIGAVSGRSLPLNSEIVSRLLDSECYSPARIERELGWRAKNDLSVGLKEMLGYRGEVK